MDITMNYDRYRNMTEKNYNKKKASFYLMRKPSDKILVPYVSNIYNKKVLEVGIGFGYYTKYYLNNDNKVKGLDINPDLGINTGVEISQGLASQITNIFKEKFDYIISFFMTEYLSYQEMSKFIEQSVTLLDKGGKFSTTIILNSGIGWLYIMCARVKRIKKYNYTFREIESLIPNVPNLKKHIIPLNSIMKIPFAILLEIEKQ